MFRKTPLNLRKLKVFADQMGAVILRPYYPVSDLFRVVADDSGLQVDFMSEVHGVKSFDSLRSRANRVQFGGHPIWLADLADIIASKKAAGRSRDKAVLDVLLETLKQKRKWGAAAKAGRSEEGEPKGSRGSRKTAAGLADGGAHELLACPPSWRRLLLVSGLARRNLR